MKRLKPITIILLVAALCTLLQIGALADDSLISNADFTSAELPDGWDIVAYAENGYSVSAQDGALAITASAENDVRFCQLVNVKPDTV